MKYCCLYLKRNLKKHCKHAIEIENKYIESNLIMDDVSEWIVIYLGDDSNKESYHSEWGDIMDGFEPLDSISYEYSM